MMSEKFLEDIKNKFGDAVINTLTTGGDFTVIVKNTHAIDVLRFLNDVSGYKQLTDLTVVDYSKHKKGWECDERFAIVYHLASFGDGFKRIRVKTPVAEEKPEIKTACELWRAADWLEREAFDMYGINFIGHPDLRRLLMYEEFEGHPLRKDYDYKKEQPLIELRESDEPTPAELNDHVQHPVKLKRDKK